MGTVAQVVDFFHETTANAPPYKPRVKKPAIKREIAEYERGLPELRRALHQWENRREYRDKSQKVGTALRSLLGLLYNADGTLKQDVDPVLWTGWFPVEHLNSLIGFVTNTKKLPRAGPEGDIIVLRAAQRAARLFVVHGLIPTMAGFAYLTSIIVGPRARNDRPITKDSQACRVIFQTYFGT
jgi:hypothetical protein